MGNGTSQTNTSGSLRKLPAQFAEYIRTNPMVFTAMLFVAAGIIIMIIFFINLHSAGYPILSEGVTLPETSYTGDFIGGVVGSIWSLAGVMLLYAALKYQKKAFDLQKEEIKNTTMVNFQQRFENTFFQMLEFQKKLLSDMKCRLPHNGEKKEYCGVDFLKRVFEIFADMLNYVERSSGMAEREQGLMMFSGLLSKKKFDKLDEIRLFSSENDKDKIIKVFLLLKDTFDIQLKHYFRYTLNILRQIELANEQIENFNVVLYADIVKSSMSNIELVLCYYDAMQHDKFCQLYIDYNLMSNLEPNEFVREEHAEILQKIYEDILKKNAGKEFPKVKA